MRRKQQQETRISLTNNYTGHVPPGGATLHASSLTLRVLSGSLLVDGERATSLIAGDTYTFPTTLWMGPS